jgi:hypothetical protein
MPHDGFGSVPLDPRAVEARDKRDDERAALTAEQRMQQIIRERRAQRANYARNALLNGWA